MYSLDCNYYEKEFPTLEALIDDVMSSGMDPCYEVTKNGVGIKEELINFIQF
jgi:hypothetical protein